MFLTSAYFYIDAPPSETLEKQPSVEKSKRQENTLWYPDLDSLMVAFNLSDGGDGDTISCSSCESEVKTVRFGTIEVREYKVIKGDHPFCKGGLALSLDWEYNTIGSIQIEDFEKYSAHEATKSLDQSRPCDSELGEHLNDCAKRRPKRLNYFERRLLLEQTGFKVEDCYGDIRSSIWLCVDEELPPEDDDSEVTTA
jgi:hypothetical protein